MHFSFFLACTAAVATAFPVALPSKSFKSLTGFHGKTKSSEAVQHEPLQDQLESLSTLSDKVTLELYKFRGGDFSSLEAQLYEFSSATDELSFTAQDGRKVERLDESTSEDVLDGLSSTEPHFRGTMIALQSMKPYMTQDQKKVVANILYNTKVSIQMMMVAVGDITTRTEDITYLTKPYEDYLYRTWRSYEKDANPEWYVSDQGQISTRAVTSQPY